MDRRLDTRYATTLPVRIFSGDERTRLDAVIADISRSGVALRVAVWGDAERLRVELPLHGDRCFLTCVVVAQTESEGAAVLHCAFDHPSERQQRFVDALIRLQGAPTPTPIPHRTSQEEAPSDTAGREGFSLSA